MVCKGKSVGTDRRTMRIRCWKKKKKKGREKHKWLGKQCICNSKNSRNGVCVRSLMVFLTVTGLFLVIPFHLCVPFVVFFKGNMVKNFPNLRSLVPSLRINQEEQSLRKHWTHWLFRGLLFCLCLHCWNTFGVLPWLLVGEELDLCDENNNISILKTKKKKKVTGRN